MQSDRFHLSARELGLIFLFWTSLATLSTVNRLVGAREFGIERVLSSGTVTLAFIEAWTWAALTPFIFWLCSRSNFAQSRWIRIPLLIAIGIAISILVFVVLDFARDAFVTVPIRRRPRPPAFAPLREIGRFRFLNQLIVYCAVLATGFAREFFLRNRKREQNEVLLQAQLAEARLDALRMQLNPHFLFNTLHAISALVERDPAGVRRMIARLSELMRHTIDSKASDEVPLRDELAFLQRYLDIMAVRFQGKLQIEQHIADGVLDALVPNLVLQPIVENALEHGVSRAGGAGRVEIRAEREGSALVLTVHDNGPGLGRANESGVGLANTRARLAQLYGDKASLTLTEAEGVLARITLPYHP
ncbi:MAG TPA: histidine kinase [Thermoanaerobaculia bacterium]|nr:histidine kinase [Thermoanaerobaculia bacterium]